MVIYDQPLTPTNIKEVPKKLKEVILGRNWVFRDPEHDSISELMDNGENGVENSGEQDSVNAD